MNPRPFIMIGSQHWHAPWHRDALIAAGCSIAAVSDSDPAAIERLAAGQTYRRFERWADMLDAYPDAVAFVLTPPDETPEVLAALVARAMPFVLEKPGTVDGAALAAAATGVAASGLATAVPFVNRLMSFWGELARQDPRFLHWTHAHFRILAGPPQRYLRDGVPWVLSRSRYGGGALRNLGIHAADAALTIANGAALTICSATTSKRLHNLEVDDFAMASLITADGRTITIEAGYCMPTETTADKQWRIHGPGWAITEDRGLLTVRSENGLVQRESAPSSQQYAAFGEVLWQMAHNRPHAMARLSDLLAAQLLVDAIYQAAA